MPTDTPPSPWDENAPKTTDKPKEETPELEKNNELETIEPTKTEEVDDLEKKKLLRKKKLKKIALIVTPIVLILLILLLITFLLGWDKSILKSSVSGVITNTKNEPVFQASVTIGGITTNTDISGNYRIDNLTYGPNQVLIKAIDYKDLTSEVTLSRGENTNRNFTLDSVDYSYIQGKFVGFTQEQLPNIVLTVNNEVVVINQDGTFQSGKLELGTTSVLLTSPDFKDYSNEVVLKEGKNALGEITLVVANDVVVNVKDWVAGNNMKDVKVKVGSVEYLTNGDGNIVVKDLPLDANIASQISHPNYLPKSFNVVATQKNTNIEIVMVGRVTYTSDRSGVNKLYSSNYDGSDEKLLYDLKDGYSYLSVPESNYTYLTLQNKDSYKIPSAGGSSSLIGKSNTSSYSGQVSTNVISNAIANKEMTFVSYSIYNGYGGVIDPTAKNTIKVRKLSDAISSYQTIVDELVINGTKAKSYFEYPIMSFDGTLVAYNMSECDVPGFTNCVVKAYYQSTSSNNRTEIPTNASVNTYGYDIIGFTRDNKQLVLSRSNELYVYTLGGSVKLVKDTGINSWNTEIATSGHYLYTLLTRDSKTDIYRYNLDTLVLEKVTSLSKVVGFNSYSGDMVVFENEGKLYIQKIGTSVAKAIPVSTNFGMLSASIYTGYD